MADSTSEKYGIQACKEVVMFVMGVIKGVGDTLADGTVNFWDIFKFCKPMWLLVPVIKDWSLFRQELTDLSADEKQQLCDLVASQLSLDNKTLEQDIELVIQTAIQMIDLFPFAQKVSSAVNAAKIKLPA